MKLKQLNKYRGIQV